MYKHIINIISYIHKKFTSKSYISKAIQEIIIILAIIVVIRENPPPPIELILLMLLTLIVLRTTIIYSHLLADKIDQKSQIRTRILAIFLEEVSNITKAVVVPIVILLLAFLNIITIKTALTIIQYILLVTLFIYGYLGGKLSGDSVMKSIALGIFTLFIGSILVFARSLI